MKKKKVEGQKLTTTTTTATNPNILTHTHVHTLQLQKSRSTDQGRFMPRNLRQFALRSATPRLPTQEFHRFLIKLINHVDWKLACIGAQLPRNAARADAIDVGEKPYKCKKLVLARPSYRLE